MNELKLDEARKRVRKMDVIDGFEDRSIGTIIEALKSGLQSGGDETSIYDALFMLLDVRSEIHKRPKLMSGSLKDLFRQFDKFGAASMNERPADRGED